MTENTPDISIIVTVHNAQKYLEACMRSVCGQTYENIEIICVDGGSKDDSPNILRRFAQQDRRIRIINDADTSYGHKLNRGFQAARGSYVGILESDDQLCRDMAAVLYDIICQKGPDVVGGNVSRMFAYRGKQALYEVQTYPDAYYDRLIRKRAEPVVYAHGAIFASLYKKSFLTEKGIFVNETPGAAFQDQGFSFFTDILADTAYYVNKPVYQYRIDNPGSSVYDDKKIFEIAWEMQFIEKELRRRNITDAAVWKEFWSLKYRLYINKMQTFSQEGRKQFGSRFADELRKDMQAGILNGDILDGQQTAILLEFLEDREYFEKNHILETNKAEEPFCEILDRVSGRQAVLFGAGQRGRRFCRRLTDILGSLGDADTEIMCFCDNSAALAGSTVMGKDVLSVGQAVREFPQAVYIITNIRHQKEMEEQLAGYGIPKEQIYVFR